MGMRPLCYLLLLWLHSKGRWQNGGALLSWVMYMYIYVYVYTCKHICMYLDMCVHVHVCTCMHVRVYISVLVRVYFAAMMHAFTLMTSSNGNIFRVTGPLWGESTGHRWIPLTKASATELWYFLWSTPWINGWVYNRDAVDLRGHRAHYDVIVMIIVLSLRTSTKFRYSVWFVLRAAPLVRAQIKLYWQAQWVRIRSPPIVINEHVVLFNYSMFTTLFWSESTALNHEWILHIQLSNTEPHACLSLVKEGIPQGCGHCPLWNKREQLGSFWTSLYGVSMLKWVKD